MENKRSRQSRRVESLSMDREENTSETSFVQGNATLINAPQFVDITFDGNLGSELTEPTEINKK